MHACLAVRDLRSRLGGVTDPRRAGLAGDKLQQIADDVGNWLGDDLVSIRNKAGDFILRNAENTGRFRLDLYNPLPHTNPHFHLEWLNEAAEWVTRRIFLGK
jgi:hypothetical protein